MATGISMEPAPAETIKPEPAPAAPLDPRRRARWLCLAAALLSGGLLWACYFPLAWGSYLGWVALVPFLVLVRLQARPRFIYFCAWLCGISFFLPVLQWMRVADFRMYSTWILLAIYCSLYFPVALLLIRRLERWRIPLVLTVPLVWVALEFCRSFLLTGFAWYYLAHTQHDILPLIQITDLGGVYLLSFLVAAVNAFLFDCAYQFPEVRDWFQQTELEPHRYYSSLELLNRSLFSELLFRRNILLEGPALALLLTGAYYYGEYRLSQDRFAVGPTVCLLQSNLDQRIREFAHRTGEEVTEETIHKHYAALCTRAVRDFHPVPNLIIWPETSYPRPWVEVSPHLPIEQVPDDWRTREIDIRGRLFDLEATTILAASRPIPHLLGMNTYFLDEAHQPRHYNSALLLNGKGQIETRFDKIHRVPFGEYLPLKDWIPFMKLLSPYEHDYSVQPGEKFTRFKVNKHHFGVLICYEDTDPFLARRYVDKTEEEPPVDFLVNISNDGWFDCSSEHEEHLAVCRFRAIECRRAMVRAVNMGVSAVIDGNGRVLKPIEHPSGKPTVWLVSELNGKMQDLPASEWHRFKGVSGIITATVPIDARFSFYAFAGDWLPIGCWLALAAGAGWSYLRRKAVVKQPAAA